MQEAKEHRSSPLQPDVEKKVGMKPRQSEPRMKWRPTERPTTTRWTSFLFLLPISKTETVKLHALIFQFGFRKWKGNVTEKPIEDRSDIIKELYSDLSTVKPQEGNFIISLHFLN